jgi:hypothetical protein
LFETTGYLIANLQLISPSEIFQKRWAILLMPTLESAEKIVILFILLLYHDFVCWLSMPVIEEKNVR